MPIPDNYLERVYAGVLGKIIGVYLGRPVENWSYDRIASELGEIQYYVHEKLNKPLMLPDDDISGIYTFMRALQDYGRLREITLAQLPDRSAHHTLVEGNGNFTEQLLEGGGIALVCEEGCISCGPVLIRPASSGSTSINC